MKNTRKQLRKTRRHAVVKHARPIIFSTTLRALRTDRNLTMHEVADAAKCSQAAVCEAEHGKEVTVSIAMRLAKFFRHPIETIWKPK